MKVFDFPIYQMDKDGLFAFVSKTELYMITNNHGSNPKNDGLVVDRYRTKRMFDKIYSERRKRISEEQFVHYYKILLENTLDKIVNS